MPKFTNPETPETRNCCKSLLLEGPYRISLSDIRFVEQKMIALAALLLRSPTPGTTESWRNDASREAKQVQVLDTMLAMPESLCTTKIRRTQRKSTSIDREGHETGIREALSF